MTRTLVGTPDPDMIPNGTWKTTLPAWAVLELDRRAPGWRTRYHHTGTGLAHRGALAVALTDGMVFVRKTTDPS